MKIDIRKEVEIEPTIRTELLSSMFEVPAKTKLSVTLTGEIPDGDRDYNIGLIVGPSGSGKTLVLNENFGIPEQLGWSRRSVIDDFPEFLSMEDISRVCQSVGFNTIPSWLRPYSVLSNGERFRVETARSLLDTRSPITIDEFTSVVDRQVAQFACHAIQKYVRESNKKLVVASCHYDIIPWLQPDWILEPGNPCRFTWRSLCQRPSINVSISRTKYETWQLFRDFHYMSQELNKAARCYGLYVATNGFDDISGILGHGLSESDIYKQNIGSESSSNRSSPERLGQVGLDSNGGSTIRDFGSQTSRKGTGDSESATDETFSSTAVRKTTEVSTDIRRLSTPTLSILGRKLRNDRGRRPDRRSEILDRSDNETYRIASLCGVLYRPHPRVRDIVGFTRMVTLPDFQGLGLAFVLANTVASAYKAMGFRLHSYPNHPAWIRSYQRSKDWMQVKESGTFSPKRGSSSTVGGFGGRRCAVFMFVGAPMNKEDAEKLIGGL